MSKKATCGTMKALSVVLRFCSYSKYQVTNKKDSPDQEFTLLESLCEMGQSPSADSAADGGINAAAAREEGSL